MSSQKNTNSSDSILKYDEYPEERPSSPDLFSDISWIDETSDSDCSINNSILSSHLTTKATSNDSIGQSISQISIKLNEPSTSKNETVSTEEKIEESISINENTPQRNLATDDQASNIDEYSDILEKLYGSNLKDELIKNLKTDEKKKLQVNYKKRSSQTEPIKRKTYRGERKYLTSSSSSQDDNEIVDDDDDDLINKKSLKTRQYLNITPTERKTRKIKFQDDSFINDSSESEGEEIEYFSITPISIKPDKRLPKITPMSELTRKVKAICDSDTEDEDYKDKKNTDCGLVNNKRLSFSDDTLSTEESEEKSPKIVKNISKKTPKKINNLKAFNKPVEIKSFLASLSDTVPIEQCHPDIKKYKGKFKRTKEELTKELYDFFNKNVFDNCLPEDTVLRWNPRLLTTAGRCKSSQKKIDGEIKRFCTIELSVKVLDNEKKLGDTLIHEMCHAATLLIDKVVNDQHGPFWKRWTRRVNEIFPELDPIERCHQYKIIQRYLYRCVECGRSFGRHSKSVDINSFPCARCNGKLELLINKVTKNGVELQKPRERTPSAFALYVKNNYAKIKKQHTGTPHKDVMKTLGQMFSDLKNNEADLEIISQQITAINISDTSNDVIDADISSSSNKN